MQETSTAELHNRTRFLPLCLRPTVDGRNPAGPDIHYTTIIARVLVGQGLFLTAFGLHFDRVGVEGFFLTLCAGVEGFFLTLYAHEMATGVEGFFLTLYVGVENFFLTLYAHEMAAGVEGFFLTVYVGVEDRG